MIVKTLFINHHTLFFFSTLNGVMLNWLCLRAALCPELSDSTSFILLFIVHSILDNFRFFQIIFDWFYTFYCCYKSNSTLIYILFEFFSSFVRMFSGGFPFGGFGGSRQDDSDDGIIFLIKMLEMPTPLNIMKY